MPQGLRERRVYYDEEDILNDNTLTDLGIYYDACGGHVLMYGSPGSAYEHFPFFFSVEFPERYPFEPPALRLCTAVEGHRLIHPLLSPGLLVDFHALTGRKWSPHYRLRTALYAVYGLLCEPYPLVYDCAYALTDASMNIHYRDYLIGLGLVYAASVATGQRRLRAASAGLCEVVCRRLAFVPLAVFADSASVDESALPYSVNLGGLVEKLRGAERTYLNIKDTFHVGRLINEEDAEILPAL
jgi:ubiquitin-protein ligase